MAMVATIIAMPSIVSAAETARAQSVISNCDAIKRTDFSTIPEAPTDVISAKQVVAVNDVPAHCEVEGIVAPNVGFKIKLPEENWNGRFFMHGCGNYCGTFDYEKYCEKPLRKGYACIVTNAGHVTRPADVNWTDGQWAYNNLQAELDYGGRASHVTAVAGKAITASFYKKNPEKSYYMGCSYGGHQAMVLAQRFPWDFDGIVGGGAPNRLGDLMQQNVWALTHAYDKNYTPIFSESDVNVLHKAVLDKCDMDDGVKDGLVGNPRACKINPDELVCKKGQKGNCLSQDKADAAKKMYSGPTDSKGKKLTAGGWAPGTELFWRKVYRPDGTGLAALAKNYFRYMGRTPELGAGWTPEDYDFDMDYKRNDVMEALYAADNPDMRRFKAAGGKFINYVGWHDMGTVPGVAIDYYETVEKTMGGREATQDFFRMFMIPGSLHCRNGEGAEDIDFLTYIEEWVEKGKAPDVMIGARRDESGKVLFTRPTYPYPLMLKYKGAGDPNDAGNFEPVMSR
ncbi:tannase/feruloyl esterase family alpha/beta hydrolase [Govanella unica]|uniref:Tannase/feruloyl esterase family alpha/beta hydrolase n=1 Tax=Govanella unica TaxID=2975056 RepID=A0A9X3Z7W2_9PROT|nr:tannase/feruloyl esterase family alpha/beta hydrolase [Govania unica]MDA5194448.1 tannase/feruloyl esterase family alpha/beta hydrolase [Govania unica]